MLVRLTGVVQLVLGLIIWAGSADGLIQVHMMIGVLFVLALWALAAVSFRVAGAGLPVLTLVWGLLVAGLGMTQQQMMPGAAHWVIQVVHLLFGLVAIGLGEMLGARARRATA